MRIIVTKKYDYTVFKLLVVNYILPIQKGSYIIDSGTNFKTANLGMLIECELIPEYKTEYKEIEYCKDTETLNDIIDILKESGKI